MLLDEAPKQTILDWRPHKGPQTLFSIQFDRNIYECFYGGAKGPGKTESLLREGVRQRDNKNYRAVIFRRTFPRLGEIIDRSFKYFRGLGAKYSDKDIQLKLPAWTFPSGAKYAFSHVQNEVDKYNHQGREWHYMGFDQLEEFTESQYLFLIAQNRTSDSRIKCYIRSTGNPGGVGHAWVKKRFIEPFKGLKPGIPKYFKRLNDEDIESTKGDPDALSRSFVPAFFYDNPSLLENDPEYIKRLRQSSETDQQAFIHGNWDVFKGQFFPMWRQSLHVVEKDIHPVFTKFLALDYGYKAPSSVGWWQIDFQGNLHCYRELYKEGLTYQQLAREIMARTPANEKIDYLVADPAIWGDKTHHKDGVQGESGAETMQTEFKEFTSIIKADNNRITGWGKLRTLLLGKDGKPFLTYSPRCVHSIRTIPTLIHDELNVEDLDTDGEDHAADQSRYAVMSRTNRTPFPTEQEERKSLEWYKKHEKLQLAGMNGRGEEWSGRSVI